MRTLFEFIVLIFDLIGVAIVLAVFSIFNALYSLF